MVPFSRGKIVYWPKLCLSKSNLTNYFLCRISCPSCPIPLFHSISFLMFYTQVLLTSLLHEFHIHHSHTDGTCFLNLWICTFLPWNFYLTKCYNNDNLYIIIKMSNVSTIEKNFMIYNITRAAPQRIAPLKIIKWALESSQWLNAPLISCNVPESNL